MGIEGPYPCEWYFLPLNPACSTTTTTSTNTTLIPEGICLTYVLYVEPESDPVMITFMSCNGMESSILIIFPQITATFCALKGTVHIEGHAQISVSGTCDQ